jgi:hypothetical protein
MRAGHLPARAGLLPETAGLIPERAVLLSRCAVNVVNIERHFIVLMLSGPME